jgi:DNA invertase Pin-like site-specific DNA recombinase
VKVYNGMIDKRVSQTDAITAAIYIPASAGQQDQDIQISGLRQSASLKGWKVLEYRERDARARTRPVFSQMREHASRHKFDVILVQSLDCFARSLGELWTKVTSLHRFGIRFTTLAESIDIHQDTWDGRMFLHTLNVLVNAHNKMLVRNVRAGVAKAQTKGIHCGRPRRSFPHAEARKLRTQGLSIRAIAVRIGVPASTLAAALKNDGARVLIPFGTVGNPLQS